MSKTQISEHDPGEWVNRGRNRRTAKEAWGRICLDSQSSLGVNTWTHHRGFEISGIIYKIH